MKRKFVLLTCENDLKVVLKEQRLGENSYADCTPIEYPCMALAKDISWRSNKNAYVVFFEYIYRNDVAPLLNLLLKRGVDKVFPSNIELST